MRLDQKRGPEMGQGGFSLLEMLVALSILAIGLLGAASMQISGIRGNYIARNVTEGTALAQDRMEFLMAQAYSSAAYFSTGTHGDPDSGNPPPAGYNISYNVAQVGSGTTANALLRIILTVTWQDKGMEKESEIICLRPQVMKDT